MQNQSISNGQDQPSQSEDPSKGINLASKIQASLNELLTKNIEYEMETNLFDFDDLKQRQTFAIKKYKDSIYYGEVEERKRSGQGVMLYNNKRVYEGDWNDDKRHGRGYEKFQNKNIYQGDYVDGKAHGKGVFTWAHGEVYDGEWREGVKEGYGIWRGTDGDSYIGQWKQSKADGYGVHQWKNGDRYEGEWRACLRHGNGSDFFKNGDQYIGQYRYGNPNGFGQYRWSNGNSYAGEFKDGLKNGKGKWKKKIDEGQKINNMYEGEYQADMKNGYGEFFWVSGNKFKGNYHDDQRNGYGEMFWIDGSIYKGYWINGIQQGLGIMIFPDGFKKVGFFDINIYKENIETIQQFDEFIKENPDKKMPEYFKQEIKEYLGYYDHNSEEDEMFINKEFKKAEKEDPPDESAFLHMQELVNNQLGGFDGKTKEQYAALMREHDMRETKNMVSQNITASGESGFHLPKIDNNNRTFVSSNSMWKYLNPDGRVEPNRLKYHEFDYVKRISMNSTAYVEFNLPEQTENRNQFRHNRNQSLNIKKEQLKQDLNHRVQNLSVLINDLTLEPLPERVRTDRRKSTKARAPKITIEKVMKSPQPPKQIGVYLDKIKRPSFNVDTSVNTNRNLSTISYQDQKQNNQQEFKLEPLQPFRVKSNKVWLPSGVIKNKRRYQSPNKLYYQRISPFKKKYYYSTHSKL